MPERDQSKYNFIYFNHDRDNKINAAVPGIKINQVPEWLMNLTEDDINNKPFPLRNVLSDSCYYPGCGTDGNPVAFLGRYCQSFIYVDHWVIREDFLNNIRRRPFTGYKTVAKRNLTPEELCPDLKGDYAVWLVVERNADKNDDFGPKRLSMLYIGADAIPTYQVIYQSNGIAPKILAIIQCNELLNNWGTGKGFKQLVLENPPQLLFTGHDGGLPVPRTPWRGYEERVFYITLSYECCFKRYDLWINRYFNRRTKYQNQINKGGDMLPMSKEMSELVDKVIDSIAKEQQELIQKKGDAMPDINNDAIVENFVVPETLNQKTEAQIETAIENALVGIDKYINIMDSLHTVNVSTDADFQRRYNGFYRMRQRTAQWYQTYYTYLENNKNNRDLSFNKVLDYLYENTNTCSPSFSSKFVATINPDKPIWDQWILKNTGHHEPRYGQADRVPMTNAIYQSIENWYAGFLKSEVGKKWLQIFNNNVQAETANKITDLKKIDFILWQIR